MPFSDESDDDVEFTPPLPADDRLWRHPSEIAAARSSSETSASSQPRHSPPSGGIRKRSMSLASAALVAGVAITLGMLAIVGTTMGNNNSSDPLAADQGSVNGENPLQALPAGATDGIVRIAVTHGTTDTVAGIMMLADGHIITSADALTDAERVTVTTSDGSEFTAVIVGIDPVTDIGVLDIEGDTHPTISVANTAELDESAATFVVEHNGATRTMGVTSGNIDNIAAPLKLRDGRTMHGMISSTLTRVSRPGASVLCSTDGSVMGLVTNRNRSDRTVYATPINYALHIARDIIAAGTARHAWIGILGVDYTGSNYDASNSDGPTGASRGTVVTEVSADGPAAQAGLRPKDIIIKVMNRPIDSVSSLVVTIRDFDPGDIAPVLYVRDGTEQTAVVTLRDRPAAVDAPR
jgi:S1-C subfamily serine protease